MTCPTGQVLADINGRPNVSGTQCISLADYTRYNNSVLADLARDKQRDTQAAIPFYGVAGLLGITLPGSWKILAILPGYLGYIVQNGGIGL